VLEQTGEAVIVKDLNAIVTFWNREAASLYGFLAEEPASHAQAALRRLSERLRAHFRGGSRGNCTRPLPLTERRKRNGETIRVTLKTMPLLDEQKI